MGTQVNGAITDLSTLVLLAVVPFNLLKGVLVSVLTFFLQRGGGCFSEKAAGMTPSSKCL